jgi:zinc transport system substrate-binding protein
MKKSLLASLLAFVLILSACSTNTQSTEKISVVASFYPIEFLVDQIAKDQVTLATLVPGGAEPHDYELSPQDLGTIGSSQVFIVNGLVEPWFSDVEQNLENASVSILNLSKEMTLLESSDPEEPGKDPHVWLDPVLMSQMADIVRDALIAADPDHATLFEANTITLKQKLTQLDLDYKTGLSQCEQKNFVTSHAAFAYLGNRYGITQVAISGLSPDEEPSAQKLKDLVDFARENKVTVIFFESLVSPALSETIAKEVGAETLVLNPLEGLTSEQMEAGEDYFSVMEENLQNLKTALVCE